MKLSFTDRPHLSASSVLSQLTLIQLTLIEHGWDFTGQADAAAKSGDKGGELLSGTVNTELGITVYHSPRTD